MLTMVEVSTNQGNLLSLPLQDISSGLMIQGIDGLDPVKAVLVSSSFAQMDGEQYQSSRRDRRNIKLTIGLEAGYGTTTVQQLRNRLYGFLMPKNPVNLRFYMSDGLLVDIPGRVESFETALFTREPAVDISIICYDPDFIDRTPVVIAGMTTSTDVETVVSYEGTVETGVKFTLNVNRSVNEFAIYHRPPDGTLNTLEFAHPLSAGDVLTISTVSGAKGVTLARSDTTSSLLRGMSPQSNWIELAPGDNHLRVYATGADIPYTIEYYTRYGGL